MEASCFRLPSARRLDFCGTASAHSHRIECLLSVMNINHDWLHLESSPLWPLGRVESRMEGGVMSCRFLEDASSLRPSVATSSVVPVSSLIRWRESQVWQLGGQYHPGWTCGSS